MRFRKTNESLEPTLKALAQRLSTLMQGANSFDRGMEMGAQGFSTAFSTTMDSARRSTAQLSSRNE